MNRPPKGKEKKSDPKNAATSAKAVEHSAKIKQQKFDKTGVTTRQKGHVAARGQRSQAKRDSK